VVDIGKFLTSTAKEQQRTNTLYENETVKFSHFIVVYE
jgi:hypothetical protein